MGFFFEPPQYSVRIIKFELLLKGCVNTGVLQQCQPVLRANRRRCCSSESASFHPPKVTGVFPPLSRGREGSAGEKPEMTPRLSSKPLCHIRETNSCSVEGMNLLSSCVSSAAQLKSHSAPGMCAQRREEISRA